MRALFSIAIAIVVIAGCSSPAATPTDDVHGEQTAEAAIEKARSTIDQFIDALESSEGQDFAVKTSIEEDGQTENFWVTDVTFDSGQFTGTVEGNVNTLQAGQEWTVSQGDVIDWKYLRDGQIYGDYTNSTQDAPSH